jgi:hypothetical protein
VADGLVALGFALVALEYYLGVGLLAAPFAPGRFVSRRRIHSAGLEMMTDASLSACLIVIALSIQVPVAAVSYLIYPNGIAGAYDSLFGWLQSNSTILWSQLAQIAIVGWVIGLANQAVGAAVPGMAPYIGPAQLYQNWMTPISSLLEGGFVMFSVLGAFGTIIKSTWLSWVMFGAVIYALPRRVGRGLGVTLLAGGLVYYLGLPLLPAFVNAYTAAATGGSSLTVSCGEIQSFLPLASDCSAPLSVNTVIDLGAVERLLLFYSPRLDVQIWVRVFLPLLFLALLTGIALGLGRILGGSAMRLLEGFL